MIDVNCYMCGSKKRKKILTQSGTDQYINLLDIRNKNNFRNWFICLDCGFIYRSPVLKESDIRKMYNRYDINVINGDEDKYFYKILNLPKSKSENYQKCMWFEKNIKKFFNNQCKPSLLDVGCGSGLFLASAKKNTSFNKFYGIEPNKRMRQIAQSKNRCVVFKSFDEVKQKFNSVTILKVLEHIKNPRDFLKKTSSKLKKRGIIFIEVPDVIDFINLQSNDPRFFIPHIYYYNLPSLKKLLSELKLNIFSHRTIISKSGRSFLQIIAGNFKNEK